MAHKLKYFDFYYEIPTEDWTECMENLTDEGRAILISIVKDGGSIITPYLTEKCTTFRVRVVQQIRDDFGIRLFDAKVIFDHIVNPMYLWRLGIPI